MATPPVERGEPAGSGKSGPDGFLFSGNRHESTPRGLLLDPRLTPLERNAWQVLRLHITGEGVAALDAAAAGDEAGVAEFGEDLREEVLWDLFDAREVFDLGELRRAVQTRKFREDAAGVVDFGGDFHSRRSESATVQHTPPCRAPLLIEGTPERGSSGALGGSKVRKSVLLCANRG